MTTMKSKFLTAFVLLAAAFSSSAQDLYLGGNIGFLLWDDERFSGSSKGEAITGGVQLGYEFSEIYAVELSSHSSLNGPDADLYSISGYRFYGDRSDWSKYIVGGLSYGDPHKFTYANDDSTSRITAVGYGEERPVASNDSAAGRAQNRRVTGELSWREEVE